MIHPDAWMALDRPAADLLGKAIADAGSEGGPCAALSFIAALLPFSSSLTTVLRPNSRPILLHDDISPERREMVVDAYLRGAYLLDPFHGFVCRNPGTRVLRLKDIAPDHFRKTEFFRSYYAHARLADEVGVIVERRDGSHIFVSLGLAWGAGTFSRRGRERLVFFLPVIAALLLKNWDVAASDEGGSAAATPVGTHRALDDLLVLDEFERLTTREREVVRFMLLGHSSKSIARCLDIAVGTVKNHRKNIYRKLAIRSQSALFARFLNLIG
ncbi:MAG: helix-turn-helix transcriptional regulator [Gammaproteobacteria bacterium]|nr:helix-turn-helix transcriptional regulator [Gammaproteobacteria bacterium]